MGRSRPAAAAVAHGHTSDQHSDEIYAPPNVTTGTIHQQRHKHEHRQHKQQPHQQQQPQQRHPHSKKPDPLRSRRPPTGSSSCGASDLCVAPDWSKCDTLVQPHCTDGSQCACGDSLAASTDTEQLDSEEEKRSPNNNNSVLIEITNPVTNRLGASIHISHNPSHSFISPQPEKTGAGDKGLEKWLSEATSHHIQHTDSAEQQVPHAAAAAGFHSKRQSVAINSVNSPSTSQLYLYGGQFNNSASVKTGQNLFCTPYTSNNLLNYYYSFITMKSFALALIVIGILALTGVMTLVLFFALNTRGSSKISGYDRYYRDSGNDEKVEAGGQLVTGRAQVQHRTRIPAPLLVEHTAENLPKSTSQQSTHPQTSPPKSTTTKHPTARVVNSNGIRTETERLTPEAVASAAPTADSHGSSASVLSNVVQPERHANLIVADRSTNGQSAMTKPASGSAPGSTNSPSDKLVLHRAGRPLKAPRLPGEPRRAPVQPENARQMFVTAEPHRPILIVNAAQPSAPTEVGRPQVQPHRGNARILVSNSQPPAGGHVDTLELTHVQQMHEYGKIVGLSLRAGLLYAASHSMGMISVLSVPDMNLVEELRCTACRIYDLDVFEQSGDIFVAQGVRKKLSKISRQTKEVVQTVDLLYKTKGITISQNTGEIYVLSRSHDAIHVYDQGLMPLRVLKFDNSEEDCNFVAVDDNVQRLYVSCQTHVFVLNTISGQLIKMLQPPPQFGPISYAVGIAQDQDTGLIMAVRRGRSQIDVYDPESGELIKTLGPQEDTLWSDVVVDKGYVFAVDYIDATIRAFKYNLP